MDTGMFGLAKYAALKQETPTLYTIEAVIEKLMRGEVQIPGYTLVKNEDIKNMINDIEKTKSTKSKTTKKTKGDKE